MVLAETEDVKTDLVGEFDLLHEVAQALRGADNLPCPRVGHHVREGIDAKFHDHLLIVMLIRSTNFAT